MAYHKDHKKMPKGIHKMDGMMSDKEMASMVGKGKGKKKGKK